MLSAAAELMLAALPEVPGPTLLWDAAEVHLAREVNRRRPGELLVVEDRLGDLEHYRTDPLTGEQTGLRTLHAAFPPEENYASILLAMQRDRELARLQLDWAAGRLSPGGVLLFAGANREGIKGHRKALKGLFGSIEAEMGGHGRVWICREPRPVEADCEPAAAYELDGLGAIYTLPGVFGHRGLDRGTEALLALLPGDWGGWRVCDLGCGGGVLALKAALGGATQVDALDHSARALACARATLAGLENVTIDPWRLDRELPRGYDAVICNPPFHSSGSHAVSLITRFVETARAVLIDGGELWLVTRRELPVERLLGEGFSHYDLVDAVEGYMVVRAVAGDLEAAAEDPFASEEGELGGEAVDDGEFGERGFQDPPDSETP